MWFYGFLNYLGATCDLSGDNFEIHEAITKNNVHNCGRLIILLGFYS